MAGFSFIDTIDVANALIDAHPRASLISDVAEITTNGNSAVKIDSDGTGNAFAQIA